MRKTNLFGATMLALAAGALPLAAFAQAPAAAPAPTAAPEPAPAPAPEPTPAPDATAPAPDASTTQAPAKKHTMHKMAHHGTGKLAPTKAGDKAVDDLNAASLDSAKTGKPFTPPPTPEAAKKEAHYGDKGTSHKMHHKAAKKAQPADATPPADASAPAPDSSTPK